MSFVYIQLNDQTVLYLTIQLGASHAFAHSLNVKPFFLTLYQVLPLRFRVDLRSIVIKKYSVFTRDLLAGASASDCLMSYPGNSLRGFYSSAEVPLVYSTAPADWIFKCLNFSKTDQLKMCSRIPLEIILSLLSSC